MRIAKVNLFNHNTLFFRSGYTEVPRLYDMCILVLQENVDEIGECGSLPFDVLEPILRRAKPCLLYTSDAAAE